MPRQAGPWPRKQRNGGTIYHATIGTKQVSLRTSDEGEAWERYRALQQGQQPIGPVNVATLAESYLAQVKDRVKTMTFAGYEQYLKHLTSKAGLIQAAAITKGQVDTISRNPKWGTTTRSRFITVVKQLFRWAEAENYLSRNPLRGLKGPVAKSRGSKAVISDETYNVLMMFASEPDFADFLRVLWETGARPSELTGLKAMQVDHERRVITLTEHKTESKGKTRRIMLTDNAAEILKRRCEAVPVPNTLLWTNARGERFTSLQLKGRLQRLMTKAAVINVTLYGFRHSFATRMLKRNVSETKVAALLGHSSTAMLHKHYSHILDETDELQAALRQGNG